MKKRNKKKIKWFWVGIIAVFGVILFKQQLTINRLNNEREAYVEQGNKLKIQNTELKEDVSKSKREDYTEILARKKLGLVEDGEILFVDKNKAPK